MSPHTAPVDEAGAVAFYADRYESDYMQEWPASALARVSAFVRAQPLPPTGAFLDFGCGTGVFTEALQQALPGWTASGTDIVDGALAKARRRLPDAHLQLSTDLAENARFDLVFSHHVLEHVHDLGSTLHLLGRLTKPGGLMVAILPCGNPGSLEHRLAATRAGGIDAARGNRFFFEDEGHLRRLTSAQLVDAAAAHGFAPRRLAFTNHHDGALQLLTNQSPEWLKRVVDPSMGTTDDARVWLRTLRQQVLRLRFLRRPPSLLVPGMEWRLQKTQRSLLENIALVASNPVTLVSGVVERRPQPRSATGRAPQPARTYTR